MIFGYLAPLDFFWFTVFPTLGLGFMGFFWPSKPWTSRAGPHGLWGENHRREPGVLAIAPPSGPLLRRPPVKVTLPGFEDWLIVTHQKGKKYLSIFIYIYMYVYIYMYISHHHDMVECRIVSLWYIQWILWFYLFEIVRIAIRKNSGGKHYHSWSKTNCF